MGWLTFIFAPHLEPNLMYCNQPKCLNILQIDSLLKFSATALFFLVSTSLILNIQCVILSSVGYALEAYETRSCFHLQA